MSGSDERTLAATLAALDDAALADVFALRQVSATSTWHDFFDAAEALLSSALLDRALTALPREGVEAIRTGDASGAAAFELDARMLRRPDGEPYAAVRARVRELWAASSHDADGDRRATGAAPATPADEAGIAAAAEHAFDAVGSMADILLWAVTSPLARTGAGPVGVADRRRLIEAGAVADADALEDLIALAESAGLLRDADRAWHATERAEAWMGAPTADRWDAVARAFVAALPSGIRTRGGGFRTPATWSGAYPLDPEWAGAAQTLARRARTWGLLAPDGTEPPWTTPLRTAGLADLAALSSRLPAEIDRVYLQADLTAIAPGPLQPALEQRLRTMAVRESRAQASTYRFSADSLSGAVAAGETAGSLREFLGSLSLTGIPQPLAYLIDRATARHGQVRVGVDPITGRTVVTAEDPDELAAVGVDQALRPVGLVEHEGALVSRASLEAVYWSLRDARYPVVAVDPDGTARTLIRHVASDPADADPPTERYAALIAGLRSAQGADAESAWLVRELEQAVRARAVVEVDVRLPDGGTRTFVLEATGLGGGRLRGRDRAADVERTLPISSIESARPL